MAKSGSESSLSDSDDRNNAGKKEATNKEEKERCSDEDVEVSLSLLRLPLSYEFLVTLLSVVKVGVPERLEDT